jgi:hypothetical protein
MGQRPLHRLHPARERAYTAFAERKDTRHAAQQALDLFWHHLMNGDRAVAGGWHSTAQRLFADQPECPEHGMLSLWSLSEFRRARQAPMN